MIMKKICIFLILLLGIWGCEESNNEYLLDSQSEIKAINYTQNPYSYLEIDTVSGKRIQIFETTVIMIERPSGSGLSSGTMSDISNGMEIKWYYYSSEVDYMANPITIPAVKVELYN